MLADEDLIKTIDNWICQIWINDIRAEYNENYILEESTLQSSFYFHMRRKIENFNDQFATNLYLYYEMPFRDDSDNRCKVDIGIILLDKEHGQPSDVLASLEFKYYGTHQNSKGVRDDIDKFLKFRQGGMSYWYDETNKKLSPNGCYFLYLVDRGMIRFRRDLQNKVDMLKNDEFLVLMFGFGDDDNFVCHY